MQEENKAKNLCKQLLSIEFKCLVLDYHIFFGNLGIMVMAMPTIIQTIRTTTLTVMRMINQCRCMKERRMQNLGEFFSRLTPQLSRRRTSDIRTNCSQLNCTSAKMHTVKNAPIQ